MLITGLFRTSRALYLDLIAGAVQYLAGDLPQAERQSEKKEIACEDLQNVVWLQPEERILTP